ncbi:Gldg family protein [Luteolibacter pohnpeiensis]|uniref:Gldg family protein n=1 Tax=Luteolibacter pohnpeiensis TaxID=454153 RepID=A0A934VVB6_9BACT|nr:Gldg family protein [Luteolibacter pohnpeiensis]MBK1883402.1 Gldg family protein [Luteolibacter pohnpeiensis]
MKTSRPVTRAAFGIAALVAIAILANWLVSLTSFGNHGADFTENKIHTLSDGTRSILEHLDTPVVIRYYATRNTDYLPEQLKLHMRRVDDLLKEYASLSHGKLRIENLDPQPDTDAEDSANLDGINGQRFNDQNLYFGLAISCLDKTSVLPFLNPNEETMLEYQLSKAISDVSMPTKPVIGVMSALKLGGSPSPMPGQQGMPGWVVYQQLKQSFDVRDIPMDVETIDPKEIKVLLLFHPATISPATEFAVDQYLLGGGTVVACLDPYSVAVQMTAPQNPMMGQQGLPTSSTLPTLLPAWGISFESAKTLADPVHATTLSDNRPGIAVLTLPNSSMPQKDSVITKDLNAVTMFLPGGFTKTGGAGIETQTLIKSSNQAAFVDSMRASRLDPTLNTSLHPTGASYDLVTYLTGKFKTAFPKGKPGSEDKDATAKDDKAADSKDAEAKPTYLKEATATGNVFLIADVDAFYDNFAYNVQNFGGMQMATPINGNITLLFNILDQATGSKYLIGSRSRSAVQRPFTVIQKMEADFNKSVGAKIEEFQEKQKAAQQKLSALQAQKSRSSELYLSPEQEAEIQKLREEQVNYSRMIRDQQKELRRQKDALAGKITLINVATMPLLVILFGLGLFIKRRSSTRAR